MALKRASSRSPSPALESAHSSPQCPSKRTKGAPGILASHRIFILQAKLSHTDISEIFDLADSADADVVGSPDDADIVVTAIGMRKRLERHIDWNLAVSTRVFFCYFGSHLVDCSTFLTTWRRWPCTQKRKALVTPDWLRDSVAQGSSLPYADYAALPDLNLKEGEEGEEDEKRPSSKSELRFTSHGSPPSAHSRAAHADVTPPAFLLPPPVPPPDVELDHTTRLCCSRASPLICVNQPLCAALDVLRRSRALESNERSALSYARAISVSMTLPCFTLFCSQLCICSQQSIKGAHVCIPY